MSTEATRATPEGDARLIPPIGERSDCPAETGDGYYCTLDAGHAGPHVAHIDDHDAAAIWEDADTPLPPASEPSEPGAQT